MNTSITPRATLHPALWVAAIAVTLFSLVGIGAITGLIPVGGSKEKPAEVATSEPAKPAEVAAPVAAQTTPAPAPAPAAVTKPVVKASTPATTHYSSKPKKTEAIPSGPSSATTYSSLPPPPPPPAPCRDCGVIESVNAITQKGEGSGLGGVLGGVLGGIVGHQVGAGTGKDIATIAGVAGGAYAGNQIEKSQKSKTHYEITVRFEDGTSRLFRQDTLPPWQSGDRVKIVNSEIIPR